ncbi:hypothetical protein NQ317_014568, partial [Molorchus minor]
YTVKPSQLSFTLILNRSFILKVNPHVDHKGGDATNVYGIIIEGHIRSSIIVWWGKLGGGLCYKRRLSFKYLVNILPTRDSSDIKSFNTPNELLDQSRDLDTRWNTFVDLKMSQTTKFQERDSGWAFEQILYLEMNINKYRRFLIHTISPKFIEKKRAVVNVRNRDQCCFAWAVTSALLIDFPAKLRYISKFEELNNITVNVYGLENKLENDKIKYEIVRPVRYSQRKLYVHVILLLLSEECVNFIIVGFRICLSLFLHKFELLNIKNISVMGAYYIFITNAF